MRRLLSALALAAALLVPATHAQQAAAGLQVLPVRGNVFMIMGGGGHVTLSAGIDGMLLVDTGSAAVADAMLAKIKEIGTMVAAAPTRLTTCVGPTCYPAGTSASFTPWGFASPSYNAIVASPAPLKPLRWIIQSHFDPDHVGGTPVLAAAGSSYAGGNLTTILGQAGCRGRRHAHRAGKRAAEDDGNELSGKRVGAGNVLHADLQDEPVHQRRRGCGLPRAGGHHRWRQLCPFPLFRCDQRGRSVHV